MTTLTSPTIAPPVRRRRTWPHRLVVAALLLGGAVVSAWPVVEVVGNDREAAALTTSYDAEVQATEHRLLSADIERDRAYNAKLDPAILFDPWGTDDGPATTPDHQTYLDELDRYQAMGRIRIPRIKVNQPIYHDATLLPLSRGVGHMYGSSLPVGGPGTNVVLAGHTGMRSKTIFDRLPEVKRGDTFTVSVYGLTLRYRVSDIRLVEPTDLEAVQRSRARNWSPS